MLIVMVQQWSLLENNLTEQQGILILIFWLVITVIKKKYLNFDFWFGCFQFVVYVILLSKFINCFRLFSLFYGISSFV